MILITLLLPKHYLDAMDALVDRKEYPNRSELIRMAIRDLLTERGAWNKKQDGSS